MSTIREDVSVTPETTNDYDAGDAFAKAWNLDAPEPSEHDEDEDEDKNKPHDDPEHEGQDGDEALDDEGSEEDQDTATISDDHKIKVSVDGQEQEFSLGALKRLAGQEASLTRKSQEVASRRKAVDEHGAVLVAQSNILLERARERYAPYANIDLLAAAKNPNISEEELVAVRNAAQTAYEDVQYLEMETARVAEALRYQQHQALMDQAHESIKVLSDPSTGIPGFNQELYGEICTFATEQGIPPDVVSNLVDPIAIKVLHMARLYQKGQKAVQTATKDKAKAPKRIVKSTAAPEATRKVVSSAKADEVMKRLAKSGSADDASDAFLARWMRSDED